MRREIQNLSINGEELSSNMFQFMAQVHTMMQPLYSLAQHENEPVCVHKRGTTIVILKIQ